MNYWQARFAKMEADQHKKDKEYIKDLERQFQIAQNNMQADMEKWYYRLAENNDITYTAAKKLLKADELEEFHWTVEQYIEKGKQNAVDKKWMKQLENASAKTHINRLQALLLQMQQEAELLYQQYNDGVTSHLNKSYADRFYHTAYEIAKGSRVGHNLAKLDDRKIEVILKKPWAQDGTAFSDRIWKNKEKLVNTLHTELTQHVIRGTDPYKAVRIISKKMDVNLKQAATLVYTESAALTATAQAECFKELDVEEFEIVATLDSLTSDICREMDGKHFLMKEYAVGMTAPPFHCNCRSVTCPYFDDEFAKDSKRIARGENGKTYYVPADMTYKEWKKAFVDGDKSGLQAVQTDDTMELRNKITDTDVQLERLKKQFTDVTEGYSYDDWFRDFESIEDGYGEASHSDEAFKKLKEIDKAIRDATTERHKLLRQKTKRQQLDTGYAEKIPYDKLDDFNAKAFEQIKIDTGYNDKKAKEFHESLKEYFNGDFEAILLGETQTAKIIRNGIDRMPVYAGSINRGMVLDDAEVKAFTDLKPGDELPRKGIIESWSSERGTAVAYSGISDYNRNSVILECMDNETGVGVRHISSYGNVESEVLSSSRYEVIEMAIENKYEYLSKHREYLYSVKDLEDEKADLKENVVCIIKVKETN